MDRTLTSFIWIVGDKSASQCTASATCSLQTSRHGLPRSLR